MTLLQYVIFFTISASKCQPHENLVLADTTLPYLRYNLERVKLLDRKDFRSLLSDVERTIRSKRRSQAITTRYTEAPHVADHQSLTDYRAITTRCTQAQRVANYPSLTDYSRYYNRYLSEYGTSDYHRVRFEKRFLNTDPFDSTNELSARSFKMLLRHRFVVQHFFDIDNFFTIETRCYFVTKMLIAYTKGLVHTSYAEFEAHIVDTLEKASTHCSRFVSRELGTLTRADLSEIGVDTDRLLLCAACAMVLAVFPDLKMEDFVRVLRCVESVSIRRSYEKLQIAVYKLIVENIRLKVYNIETTLLSNTGARNGRYREYTGCLDKYTEVFVYRCERLKLISSLMGRMKRLVANF